MTSPLFRTLAIGSLRYWGGTVQVVKTQVFNELEIETGFDTFALNVPVPETEIILQDTGFTLELSKEIDFILEDLDLGQRGVCL